MNTLDIVLLVLAALYALSGYRQGFLVGAASTIGLVLGGFIGVKIAPKVLAEVDPGFALTLLAIAVVLVCAFVGQGIAAFLGHRLREHVRWRPAKVFDALSGAVLSAAAMLVIAWVLGVAVSGANIPGLNKQVRDSAVLSTVDEAMPGSSARLLSAFNSIVDSSQFPRYLEPFVSENIRNVPAPEAAIAKRPAVQQARDSVVKILGNAPSCGRRLEGSGFVYAPHRVMTNAHVVAGVDEPEVRVDHRDYAAEVVYYDENTDVAVLYAPDLDAPDLDFGGDMDTGDPVAVLGYPGNGPYDVEPGRIREEQTLRSPDIYGDGTVRRDTYSIYASVREGNSGGPLVDTRGQVVGVVFAASVVNDHTGYALTAQQVTDAAQEGASTTSEVDTGACAM